MKITNLFSLLLILSFLTINSMSSRRAIARAGSRVLSRLTQINLTRSSFAGSARSINSNNSSNVNTNNELCISSPDGQYKWALQNQKKLIESSPALYEAKKLNLFYKNKTENNGRMFTLSFTGTTHKLFDKKPNSTIVLLESYNKNKVLQDFNQLTKIVQHEIIRDMSKIGKIFTDNNLNVGLGTSSSKFVQILEQLPPELRNYYSNIITNLSRDPDVSLIDCIEMYTQFKVDSNNTTVITEITTNIACNLFASPKKDCCYNCKDSKQSEQQKIDTQLEAAKKQSIHKQTIAASKPLQLPATVQMPYEVLSVNQNANQTEIKKKYFELRMQYEKQSDKESLQRLEVAYNQLQK